MNMMIQAAKPETQYIYLTPLETNFKDSTKSISIFRWFSYSWLNNVCMFVIAEYTFCLDLLQEDAAKIWMT